MRFLNSNLKKNTDMNVFFKFFDLIQISNKQKTTKFLKTSILKLRTYKLVTINTKF